MQETFYVNNDEICIKYKNVPSMPKQGKKDEIKRKYGREYDIHPLGGGNGNWLLTPKSNGIYFNDKSCRSFVLDHYGKKRLRDKLAETFIKDVKEGNIPLNEIYFDE